MKQNNNILGSINFEDIKKARFSKDSRNIFIKNIVLRFPSAFGASRFWWNIANYWLHPDIDAESRFRAWLSILCEDYEAETTYSKDAEYKDAEDVPCHFRKAIDLVIASKKTYYGSPMKVVSDDENALIMEAYNMQDCLAYTIEDLGLDAEDELLFEYYASDLTTIIWYYHFYGREEFIRLLHYFFDRYLPLLRASAPRSSSGIKNQN